MRVNPDRNSIYTIAAIKQDTRWRFTSFQNTRAQYLGRPEMLAALTRELEQENNPNATQYNPSSFS